jgi:hypothetical protein
MTSIKFLVSNPKKKEECFLEFDAREITMNEIEHTCYQYLQNNKSRKKNHIFRIISTDGIKIQVMCVIKEENME